MKDKIREFAFELGFDLCGFSKAEPPAPQGEFLKDWISRGYHAEMKWMERTLEKRLNPLLVLENAKSIISLGVSYYSGESELQSLEAHDAQTEFFGKIAKYSQFVDYHIVIKEKLIQIAQFIRGYFPDHKVLYYVDTGAVLERGFGQRAGIGFIGKHTNLINKKSGNWILLGELITTIDFEPDLPEKNYCGKCRRCLDACPTGAIVAPFTLNASLCISYLTIEHKGIIPVELRSKIGDHLFGCDDCLDVCPWNRFAREGKIFSKNIKRLPLKLDISRILTLNDAEFKKMFGGTPVERTGLRRLCRNACVVLGNIGTPDVINLLESVISCNDPLIVEHARWAIDEIKRRYTPGISLH